MKKILTTQTNSLINKLIDPLDNPANLDLALQHNSAQRVYNLNKLDLDSIFYLKYYKKSNFASVAYCLNTLQE